MSKPKSKAGTYLSIGTSLFSTVSAVKRLKTARHDRDKLELADAVISVAAIVTSIALLARELRRMNREDSDVLAG